MIQRPPLEADATPIGRDWVEYANSLRDQLEQAQARERGLREFVERLAMLDPKVGLLDATAIVGDAKALAAQSEGSDA